MCLARGTKGPAPDTAQVSAVRHVSTHPIVRCKPLIPDPQEDPPSEQNASDVRLAKLEERIEQLQSQLLKLESKQETMQALLLTSFAEAMTKFPATGAVSSSSHGSEGHYDQ